MTAPAQASSLFASLGLDIDLGCSPVAGGGFGVDLDAPANFVVDFDVGVSVRMHVPGSPARCLHQLHPTSRTWVRVSLSRLDWIDASRESGSSGRWRRPWSSPCWLSPEATSFALVADRPMAEGGMMSNTRLIRSTRRVRYGQPTAVHLTPTKTNGMERVSMDFRRSEFSSIFGTTSSGVMQEASGVVRVGMGAASDRLIHPDSLESAGIVDTMRDWMPKTRDVEMHMMQIASRAWANVGLRHPRRHASGGGVVGMQASDSGSAPWTLPSSCSLIA